MTSMDSLSICSSCFFLFCACAVVHALVLLIFGVHSVIFVLSIFCACTVVYTMLLLIFTVHNIIPCFIGIVCIHGRLCTGVFVVVVFLYSLYIM